LSATGGAPPYRWAIVGGALPPGLALVGNVIGGIPTQAGTFAFTVQVTDGDAAVASAQFQIPVVPPTDPTAVSPSWAGYVLSGSTYTAVAGSFNVPQIYTSPTDADVAEWVGLDGAMPSDPTIIQAGIDETYSASTNQYFIRTWIELFPAPPVYFPLAVNTGNEITVTISEVSVGEWNVVVKNDSTGQAVGGNYTYGGPGLSVEWIAEAPGNPSGYDVLAHFDPIMFTQLGVSSSAGALTRWVIVQNGQQVGTPSPLTANGFTVGYGAITPAPP
jgi:hypothetical protein